MWSDDDEMPESCGISGCAHRATQLSDPAPVVIDLEVRPIALCSDHAFAHLAAMSQSAVELAH